MTITIDKATRVSWRVPKPSEPLKSSIKNSRHCSSETKIFHIDADIVSLAANAEEQFVPFNFLFYFCIR